MLPGPWGKKLTGPVPQHGSGGPAVRNRESGFSPRWGLRGTSPPGQPHHWPRCLSSWTCLTRQLGDTRATAVNHLRQIEDIPQARGHLVRWR